MPVCARAVQQADGSLALVLDPSATDLTACAYVVQTGAELGNSLVSFSASDGALLSSGVISCWLAAYGIRSVIEVIKGPTNETG
jgi:hypothetical protein